MPGSQNNLGLSFSSVTPGISIGAGGFLNSFTAAGTGTFASNPAPVFNPPTAAGVNVEGRIFSGGNIAARRATVLLTDGQGNTRTAVTNSYGYFKFEDILAGQTVTISVSARGYTYAPQIISINDNISNLNFYPVE